MCTALFAFGIHPRLLFFLAFNRDEFLERPTTPAQWWEDEPDILAGRDEVKKGTWLALSRSGRFAFLTNFREVSTATTGASRGALTVDFVKGNEDPLEYLRRLDMQTQHNGFNLVVGDLKTGDVAYCTNRDPNLDGPVALAPGLYGLSNGVLSSTWPKVEKAKRMLKELLLKGDLDKETFPLQQVLDVIMLQREKVRDPSQLPGTAFGEAVDRELSSILIEPLEFRDALYGTRTQTVITGWDDDSLTLYERTLQPASAASGVKAFHLSVPMAWKDAGSCKAS